MAEDFKKQSACLGESAEKYITLAVPIEKEVTRIDKNEVETTKNLKIQMIFWKSFVHFEACENFVLCREWTCCGW